MKPRNLPYIVLAFGLLLSCKKKDKQPSDDFDRAGMLANYCDNQILPQYADFTKEMGILNQNTIDFTANVSSGTLATLKSQWKNCFVYWQTIKVYGFGASSTVNLKSSLSFFPVDTAKINHNINNNVSNLDSTTYQNVRGFNAMDYLLYHADDNTILQEFSDTKRQNYLKHIAAKMLIDVQNAKAAWSSYSTSFKAADGNDANSSLSIMVNEFNKDYELVKNAKVAIPLGKQSLDIKRPDYVEARYSGISASLIKANLDGLSTVFKGGSGLGFDDYLNKLNKKVGDQFLSDNIVQQLTESSAKVASFSTSLENEIMNNDTEVNALYQLLQGLVPEIKTDMPSAFGVFITYNDTDGD
jgi:predicted lipoprotein